MNKLERSGLAIFTNACDKLNEIIDWINAQDKPSMISPICAQCKNKCKDMTDTNAETCTAFSPSIEQELESGLYEGHNAVYYIKDSLHPCTRIFLPEAKYKEWYNAQKPLIGSGVRLAVFHDIPVFSYSGDEIIYCTD